MLLQNNSDETNPVPTNAESSRLIDLQFFSDCTDKFESFSFQFGKAQVLNFPVNSGSFHGKVRNLAFPTRTRNRFELSSEMSHYSQKSSELWKCQIEFDRIGSVQTRKICLLTSNILNSSN